MACLADWQCGRINRRLYVGVHHAVSKNGYNFIKARLNELPYLFRIFI